MYGFNRHVWDLNVDPRLYVVQRKYVLAMEVLFCVASGLIKVSILLFFRRISSRAVSRLFAWASWFCIGFIITTTVPFMLIPMFGCQPISAFWDQADIVKILNGYQFHCFNEGVDVLVATVISAVQDLLAAVLPTFLYWNLRIPVRQQLALFGIFAIGYGAVALGVLRAYYSYRIFFATYDVTWETWSAWEMTLLELHVGAMCANAPALKVFCKEYLKLERLGGSWSKWSSKASRSQGSTGKGPAVSSRTGTIMVALCRGTSAMFSRNNGYLSEPHTNVSVDSQGGLQRQKNVHFLQKGGSTLDSSMYDSMDTMNGHYDVEMAEYKARSHVASKHASTLEMEGVQVFPPQAPPPTANSSVLSLPFQRKSPLPWQRWT
jgi:hypothetical protein